MERDSIHERVHERVTCAGGFKFAQCFDGIVCARKVQTTCDQFRTPPRLPFWQHEDPDAPDDVCDIWEMDRGVGGWFFDRAVTDDWQCDNNQICRNGQCTVRPVSDASTDGASGPQIVVEPTVLNYANPIAGTEYTQSFTLKNLGMVLPAGFGSRK